MKIPGELRQELIAHVLEDPGNEVCGIVAVEADGSPPGAARATRVFRATNVYASALRFEIAPKELLELSNTIDKHGWEIGAIYHSHVRSKPYPSQTDINFAANWPGVEWIIVGLADGEAPEVRSYLIEGAQVKEVPMTETST
jgi:proteasome lid subunit RPN8/RPN11